MNGRKHQGVTTNTGIDQDWAGKVKADICTQ